MGVGVPLACAPENNLKYMDLSGQSHKNKALEICSLAIFYSGLPPSFQRCEISFLGSFNNNLLLFQNAIY